MDGKTRRAIQHPSTRVSVGWMGGDCLPTATIVYCTPPRSRHIGTDPDTQSLSQVPLPPRAQGCCCCSCRMAGSTHGGNGASKSTPLAAAAPCGTTVGCLGGGSKAAPASAVAAIRATSTNSRGSMSTTACGSRRSTSRTPTALRKSQCRSNLRAGFGGTCGPPLSSRRKSAWPSMSLGACSQSMTCACGSAAADTSPRHQAQNVAGQRGHWRA
mmetsp:Transcript_18977/g.60614  ORF Transcript_18977/g.60614 Transcript_18977/m.60614 type:complete len:214 (-) Transcript_18977:1627-2268(-)